MGGGASVSMPDKMPSDDEIKEAASKMPPEAIEVMKKIIAAAEAKDTAKPAATVKGEKTREVIKKIGNSDEATDMERAIFMWDEAICKEVLKEILNDKPQPEVVNGPMLVMEEVKWQEEKDQKDWPMFLQKVAMMWFEEQAVTEKPFVPPEKAKEHCIYQMDAAAADAWLEKLGVKKVGKTGKELIDVVERSEAFGDMDAADKVSEAIKKAAVLFMKDLVKAA